MKKIEICIIFFMICLLSFISCEFESKKPKNDTPEQTDNIEEESKSEEEEEIQLSSIKTKYGFSKRGEPVLLSCSAVPTEENHFIKYPWYKSADGSMENGTLIEGANGTNLVTEGFSEKGILYYYCVVTETIICEDNTINNISRTIPFSVIYTSLPIVQIDTVNGEEPTGEAITYEEGGGNYGATLKNETKVPARMYIYKDGQENAVYDSGEYNKDAKTGLTIKLRGNTSAFSEKKPYKIKLQKKADLLAGILPGRDSSYKDKEWILLKDATSLNTFVGMAVADIAGTPWTPEFAFVNVVINGDYRGVYLLIEAITKNEKRINVSDNGYIIERDAYWWNEDVKFITSLYNQKYTFKYPDDDDITDNPDLQSYIENYMNELEQHIQNGTYEDYIDVESFARWLLIHDILGTWDGAGSNCYMIKNDNTENSKVYMATTWDYDTNYREKDVFATQHYSGRAYGAWLLSNINTAVKDSYKSQWETVSISLWNTLLSKIEELQNLQGEDINLSRKCDAIRYDTKSNSIENEINRIEDWFTSRTVWLNTAISDL
ncbi:MAG: CotH kinase family protein [Treponema sp.]|nr:CotH kinase family protein [Treponema sp.]